MQKLIHIFDIIWIEIIVAWIINAIVINWVPNENNKIESLIHFILQILNWGIQFQDLKAAIIIKHQIILLIIQILYVIIWALIRIYNWNK
ncbi:hypothetical protein [Spiroplasma endosymbiont of Seladonia tumulorum]|uniref:hypothetical protein n=1 Tax=Spiroplasma endosymbiont of Seladonia tumulorum TaxID=3066321 RepID=UPI0030CE698D